MKNTTKRLEEIIQDYSARLHLLQESEISIKPSPHKWSKKEILGHLVDSAQNNLRRFIVAQYEDVPTIIYQQDFWVKMGDYANAPAKDLVTLWQLLNAKLCRTDDPEPHSIAWLAQDYIRHLLHHLHQILKLEPVSYP